MATPFRIIIIDVAIESGTRIQWDLVGGFSDPDPLSFQLQYGSTGDPDADDWVNVGSPVTNQFYVVDTVKRVFGREADAYYRVVLTSPVAVYISPPASMLQWMHHYQWRMARDIIRKERLRHRMFASVEGYLLPRRRYGTPCPDCLDPNTHEVINASNCETCFGTGIEGGYFTPIAGFYADVSLRQRREHLDDSRGISSDIAQQARFLGYPILRSGDIWCNKHSDERYVLHSIADGARIGNTAIVQTAELRVLPFSSIEYQIPLV